ncbi:hypothetical protein [Natrinema salaciae]|uniref:Uncharacterized protein n=1 Tax=Natrinema salaciae TaxID=1186196 RepID=A0A1H9BQ13_9EURY|nr:hypothetical protein [Natrinema salaciae]SEP91070.1 hypothetical protein SAMN04489841_0820 [Natrinema salaciae]
MRRRQLLAVTTGAVCGLAGCTGSPVERLQTDRSGSDGDGADRDGSESASDEITVGNPDEVPFPDAHPPHELELRNDGETDRTVSVAITISGTDGDGADGSGDDTTGDDGTVLEREFDLSADETLTFVLVEPRSYAVAVTTSGDGGESTVTDAIDRHPFDCTRSRTRVTFRESGVGTESTSTAISCPVPEIADATLEIGEQGCADRTDGDDATVEFADETVVVDGDITTPTPCHVPSIAGTDYDERRDLLTVTVGVGEGTDESCIDCLGTAAYEARIDLEGRYPGRVEVRHESRGDDRRITTTECSADW